MNIVTFDSRKKLEADMVDEIIKEIEPFASSRTKKSYMLQGAVEPLYGIPVKYMKPLAKKLKKLESCQEISYSLYNTGNYDLMYLASMIVDPHKMTKEHYHEWLEKAYFYMISDYIVAVCLSETDIAFDLANQWINSDKDLYISAGYSTYSWMLSRRPDTDFNTDDIKMKLIDIKKNIAKASNRSRYAMYYFVYNVGVSYTALHEDALEVAKAIGDVSIKMPHSENLSVKMKIYNAHKDILKASDKNRIGFKRKYVRC